MTDWDTVNYCTKRNFCKNYTPGTGCDSHQESLFKCDYFERDDEGIIKRGGKCTITLPILVDNSTKNTIKAMTMSARKVIDNIMLTTGETTCTKTGRKQY